MVDARGKATKFLLDMLNIGGNSRVPGAPDAEKNITDKEGDDSASDRSASFSSSTASPVRQSTKTMSEMSMSDGEIPASLLDGSTPRISLHAIKQSIQLAGDDRSGSVSVYGNQVEIVTSQGNSTSTNTTASNKIKINPMVNYEWDLKYYRGSLVALGSKFIAYTLKGRSGYVVRLLNPETATRALIKGFIGLVTDLAFAHTNSDTLACIDEGGNLYVWSIKEEDSKIEYNIKLRVNRSPNPISEYHRVIWSPYLPEEGEDLDKEGDDPEDERPLAVTHHNQAEVIDIPMVLARCGCNEVTADMLKEGEGYIAITEGHTKPITDGSLSPDGAVLATGSEDGYVRFWQVGDMMPDTTPSCLHEFQPHDGSPVSSLTFCDNHTIQEKDVPMWRFMITGAEYNREIKIWCTVTWTCIQTLRFTSPTEDIANVLGKSYFKARLDATARYLVLSDIGRKVLYILLVHQDREEGRAHITSITDFQLTQPLLSFIITKAKLFKLKSSHHGTQQNGDSGEINANDVHDEEMEEVMDESELEMSEKRRNLMVQLRLYSIHTKSLQELLVHFQPEPSVPPPTPSNMSSIATTIGSGVRDALSDLSGMETGTEASTDVEESDPGLPDTPTSVRPKLITPDAFTKSSSRPESLSSSVTMVSALGASNGSDGMFEKSISSILSDTTVKSSLPESPHGTPRSSFGDTHVVTPTSLQLPQSPLPLTQERQDTHILTPTSLPLPQTPLLLPQEQRDTNILTPTSLPLPQTPLLLPQEQRDTHILTPTSLPLPQTPLLLPQERQNLSPTSLPIPDTPLLPTAPDASAVPIPRFQPSPFDILTWKRKQAEDDFGNSGSTATDENEVSKRSSMEEEHAVMKEEKEPDGTDLEEAAHQETTASVHKEPMPTKEVSRTDSSGIEDHERSQSGDNRIIMDNNSEGSEVEEGAAEAWSTPAASSRQLTELHRLHLKTHLVASPMTARVDIPPESTSAVTHQDSLITQLISLIQTQQRDLATLRAEVRESQTCQSQGISQMLQEEIGRLESAVTEQIQGEVGRLENTVTERVQGALAQHSMEENQRLEKALRDKHSQDKKRQEHLTSTLSQAVTNSITGKLEKTLKQEVKSSVVPAVQKVLTPVQEQLNTTMAQKLTAADAVLKDSVNKMVKNKAVIDAIGNSAAAALQGPIQASYREAFQSTILPAFERSCQSMFQQINDAFQKGTHQYLERVNTSLDNQRRDEKDARDPVVQQLQSQVQAFQAESQRLRNTVTSDIEMLLQKQLANSLHSLHEEMMTKLDGQVTTSLQETVQAEIRLGLQEFRPQYQETPVIEMGTRHDYEQIQRRITDYLQDGQVAMAFQEALTAADLSLVMMVCESVDVNDLFSQSEAPPLSQPILLSLIQQLSVDLLTNTELKHRYLEEAVMSLDTSNEVTSEHMPTVLQGLCEQLRVAIAQCTGPTQKSLRVLLMAAQSLLR